MKNVLVVVKTPMQLLNAVEYLSHVGIDTKNVDLFLVNDHKEYTKILNSLSEKWLWKKKKNYILLSSSKVVGRIISAIITRISIHFNFRNKYDHIIVGHYSQVIQRYFLRRKKGIKVLVDDGIQTLNFNGLRLNEIDNGIVETYQPDTINRFINLLWDFKKVIKNSIIVYTSYNIEPNKIDQLLTNNFKFFKSQIKGIKHLDAIVFIGSDIVEIGGITENDFLNALKKIIDYYKTIRIIYIPKKTENIEKLKMLSDRIEIKKIAYPIELFPIIEGVKPIGFASLFSSAIFNLLKIYGDSIEYSLIDIRSITKKDNKFDFVFKAYEYRENTDAINILN